MDSIHDANRFSKRGLWGRAWQVSLQTWLSCFLLLIFSPVLVFYFYIVAFHFDCSLVAPIQSVWLGTMNLSDIASWIPQPTFAAFAIVTIWFSFQVILAIIPDLIHRLIHSYRGGHCLGAITPAGNQLIYNVNGLQAWLLSNITFFIVSYVFGWFSPTIVFDNWGGILWVVNALGFLLAIYVYLKGRLFPSFINDRKFSGSLLYDFFMGIELNPRIGHVDLKFFFNGRPGIVAWTLINISFVAAQHERYGYVTNSMWIVNILQCAYVLYFFWKESWYLKTIDIHHDHFGWMLAWGDLVWLPYMYTLQALFLVFHPVELSTEFAVFVLGMGVVGFYIFASANNQKDSFRQHDGKELIWGKTPKAIDCEYTTKDGCKRKTRLLISGWWGIGRHMNYTGDLILSLAYSLACGFGYLFPYFYFVFLSILLIHRCLRDEKRCRDKYGEKWLEYRRKVPYRLIPYIW